MRRVYLDDNIFIRPRAAVRGENAGIEGVGSGGDVVFA